MVYGIMIEMGSIKICRLLYHVHVFPYWPWECGKVVLEMQCVILVSICGQLNNLSMRHVTYSALPCVLTLVSKQPPALGGLCKSPRLQMAFMGLPRE